MEGAPPPSYEGSEQCCFSAMYACLDDVDADKFQLHAYGRHLVHYHQRQHRQQVDAARAAMLQQAGLADLPRPPPESVLRRLGRQAATSADAGAGHEVQLRVVFQKRGGSERQLVNAEELVERCNSWAYTAPSGVRVRALCWQVRGSARSIHLCCSAGEDARLGDRQLACTEVIQMTQKPVPTPCLLDCLLACLPAGGAARPHGGHRGSAGS